MTNEDKDMYGVPRESASAQLDRYLQETLSEPQARLDDLHLENGRWQADVADSQRGIRVVFLEQHAGQVVPGHMTADAPST